ncbi:response regulator [Desulfobulbus sp. F4]|nr:response regulator [Desulfobulbus sp. F4]
MAKKLLIIDDSPTQVRLIKAVFDKVDYEILTASDGEGGLKKAASEKPDIIILDVIMPKMNGFQVCRSIKSTKELKQIPIIILTSKNQEADSFWGKTQGADMYMTKPFDQFDLLKAVAGYISRHRLMRFERNERILQRRTANETNSKNNDRFTRLAAYLSATNAQSRAALCSSMSYPLL